MSRDLEKKVRDLHSLHEVGRELGLTSHSERVLGLVAGTARNVAGTLNAEVVAHVGSRERPWWSAPAAVPFTVDLRRSVESCLARRRAEGSLAGPDDLPSGAVAIPIAHGGVLFGWILLMRSGPLSDDVGELLGILSGQAATALANIQLLDQRLESERLSTIGRMISSIVHDFRNPMTAIRGYAAMMEDGDLEPERRKQCAHLVVEETDRLNGMIDEILEFTRPGGGARLKRRTVSVEELAAKLRRVLEPDMSSRNIDLVEELTYRGSVTVDLDRLMRAMINIATNALDAMDGGGTLTLRTRRSNGLVEIDLADTGTGIPPELQARIYDPFFTHGKPKGIGLGMSITRKIVEEHGGRIQLASEVGKGTCFTVSLPTG